MGLNPTNLTDCAARADDVKITASKIEKHTRRFIISPYFEVKYDVWLIKNLP